MDLEGFRLWVSGVGFSEGITRLFRSSSDPVAHSAAKIKNGR
jgi:hypothetical protein